MAIAGIVFMIAGAVLWWVQNRQRQRCNQIKLARQTQAADLKATAAAVAAEIGGGSWRDYVWLWGTPQLSTPLISEFKQVACISHTSTVVREYEETVREKDSSGSVTTRTQRGSETISEYSQRVPFNLTDNSGQVWVDPEGAKIELVEVLNDFRPGAPAGGMLSYGPFSLALGSDAGGARRTLGYRYREWVLPLDRPVLVVGTASDGQRQAAGSDRTSTVVIEKPAQADQPYIVTTKSHEAVAKSVDQSSRTALGAMVACLAVGILLLLAAVLG
ncbi:MAG: E3 ubiquitin ligase family protein [Nodosilinea sp.]